MTSSRSCTSVRAFRSMTSRPSFSSASPHPPVLPCRICIQPTIALSGVRLSCESDDSVVYQCVAPASNESIKYDSNLILGAQANKGVPRKRMGANEMSEIVGLMGRLTKGDGPESQSEKTYEFPALYISIRNRRVDEFWNTRWRAFVATSGRCGSAGDRPF
jgi:hypothetical protein